LSTVIFDQYNPAGRLPITFYPASYINAVKMPDMQMRPSPTNPGRTYKLYTGQAVSEFGNGVSYTKFAYSWSNNSSATSYEIQSLMKNNCNEHKLLIHQLHANLTNIRMLYSDGSSSNFLFFKFAKFRVTHLRITQTVRKYITSVII
jgi:hypothetical protein